jgi:phosphatidylethanolamine/phosphatidyl-N-methylethanolamine N-methyltransferase
MNTESVERAYAFYSGFYDLIWHKVFHRSRESAVQLLNLRKGESVLDVGVGTGLSLPAYPKDCRVTGIDLCSAMLEKGRERLVQQGFSHIELHEMDAMKMDFPDDSFDAVLAAYAISAVPDPYRVLDEMIRVCKKGGRIVFLNHFKSDNRFISSCETMISPFTQKMGWRSDLPMENLFAGKPVLVEKRMAVKPLNYWDLILCTNQKGGGKQEIVRSATLQNGNAPHVASKKETGLFQEPGLNGIEHP